MGGIEQGKDGRILKKKNQSKKVLEQSLRPPAVPRVNLLLVDLSSWGMGQGCRNRKGTGPLGHVLFTKCKHISVF